eukprot:TRINITY_DN1800_c0_g1_i1.p1 TRINITY_DN1800_c0_g1~~TRINITY_DN1800_c0_g1_i1.p1  ORF type:complete len:146 (-),score=49.89 TRINITY_DN1800_c0_g1_i1:31-468(-)
MNKSVEVEEEFSLPKDTSGISSDILSALVKYEDLKNRNKKQQEIIQSQIQESKMDTLSNRTQKYLQEKQIKEDFGLEIRVLDDNKRVDHVRDSAINWKNKVLRKSNRGSKRNFSKKAIPSNNFSKDNGRVLNPVQLVNTKLSNIN